MAFSSIPSGWLDVGDPVKKELLDLIKSNQDDLDSRISGVSAAVSSESPIQFIITGDYWKAGSSITEAGPIIRITHNLTLTSARLQITDAGTSGTLTTDVKYSTDSGSSWNTIFSSIPSLAYTAGNYAENTGTLSVTELDAGDYLKLDITSVMTLNTKFIVYLTWEIRG